MYKKNTLKKQKPVANDSNSELSNTITAKILIIGSSDLESKDYAFNNKDNLTINRESDVLNAKFPCNEFIPKTTNSDKTNSKNSNSEKKICKTCHLDFLSHEVGYEFTPHNLTNFTIQDGQLVKTDLPENKLDVITHAEFSDFWREKKQICAKLIAFKNYTPEQLKNVNIIYETCDPMYNYNPAFLPKLTEINASIARNIGVKSISPGKNHLYNVPLSKIPLTRRTKYYDMIVDCNTGFLWLLKPSNIKLIFRMLKKGGAFGHMYSSLNKINAGRLVFNDFLSSVLTFRSNKKLNPEQLIALNHYNHLLVSYPVAYRDEGILVKVSD